jgi:aconitase A
MMLGRLPTFDCAISSRPAPKAGGPTYQPDGEVMTIYDAAMKYKDARCR